MNRHEFQELLHTLPPMLARSLRRQWFWRRVVARVFRLLRRLLWGGFWLILSCILLLVAGFQFQTLRQFARGYIVEYVNSKLAGRLDFSDFHGNIIGGLTLDNICVLSARNDTILTTRSLTVRYDLQSLFNRALVINRIALEAPVVRLLRSYDSSWNVFHILRSDTAQPSGQSFIKTLSVRDISIHRGSVLVYDSLGVAGQLLRQTSITQALQNKTAASLPYNSLQHRGRFDASWFQLDTLTLSIAATLHLRQQSYALSINRLGFHESRSGLRLQNLALSVELDSNHAEIFNVRIQTALSAVRFNMLVDSVNVLRPMTLSKWKQKPVRLTLHADSLNAQDLQRFSAFVPAFDLLGGAPSLKVEVKGRYGDIRVERFQLGKESGETMVHLDGRLQNLHRVEINPMELRIDAKLRPMKLSYNDLLHYIPGLCTPKEHASAKTNAKGHVLKHPSTSIIPDLSPLGTVTVQSGSVSGELGDLHVHFEASSAVGSIATTVHLDSRTDTLRYDGSITTHHLNLAPLFRDSALVSNINASVSIAGQGTTLKTLSSELHLESSASQIAGRRYDYLLLNARARDGGYIDIERLKMLWNRRPEFEEYTFDEGSLPPAQLLASGWIDLQDESRPEYRLDAQTTNFDFRSLLPDFGVETDVTMQINVAGRGFHPDSLQGTLRIAAQQFTTAYEEFEPFSINVRLERFVERSIRQDGTVLEVPNRRLHMRSELADVDVRGEFSFKGFLWAFASQVDNIIYEVRRKYHWTRDSASTPITEGMFIPATAAAEPLDVTFRLNVRNLSLVSLFTGTTKILGEGELTGSIRGTTRQYRMRIDTSYLASFSFSDIGVHVNAWKAHLWGEFYNRTSGDSINAVGGRAFVQCDSAFSYEDFFFPKAQLKARYDNEELTFDVQSDYQTDSSKRNILSFRVRGVFNAAPHDAELLVDTLWLAYKPQKNLVFTWTNVGNIRGLLNEDGLTLEQCALRRLLKVNNSWQGRSVYQADSEQEERVQTFLPTTLPTTLLPMHAQRREESPLAEYVYLSGLWWFDHFQNARLALYGTPLADFNRLFPPDEQLDLLHPLNGRVSSLALTVDGTLDKPLLTLALEATNVFYNGASLGNVVVTARHQDSMVVGKMVFTQEATNEKILVVSANQFPINLAFIPTGERIADNRPINIRFETEALPMQALARFIPGVNTVRGLLQAQFTITGQTHNHIAYQGRARLDKGSFITDATNLRYFADGTLSILNNAVTIESFNVSNDPLDYQRGRATATGTATLRGFDIASFDIALRTSSLLVLGNASRITHPSLYGDVVVQCGVNGAEPLRFYGTLDKPYLRGNMNIMDANIILPEGTSTKTEYSPFCFETVLRSTEQSNGVRSSLKNARSPVIIARDCPPETYRQDTTSRSSAVAQKASGALPSVVVTHLTDTSVLEQHHGAHHEAHHEVHHAAHHESRNESRNELRSASDYREVKHTPTSSSSLSSPISQVKEVRSERTLERGFADKIDYDVNVFLKGNFFITMNFSPIDQLVASVAQDNPDKPLRYVQTPNNPDEPKLFGDLRVRDGSKYNFYRIFNTTGALSFTTGAMDNPQLNLRAVLRGQRISPTFNSAEEYTVVLDLTGTKKLPRVAVTYFIGDRPGVGDPIKVQNDAIMLMVFGKTQDELLLRTAVSEATTQTSSSAASKMLTDLLQGTGIIRSADIYFASAQSGAPLNLAQARVQLTGEISDLGVVWQVGNDIGANAALNPSFTIDIPLRSFLNVDAFRNVMLQVNRSAININSALSRQQRELEIKLTVQNRW
jgi:hypothetical protein